MNTTDGRLLEIRMFRVRPGTREEFDRISREGTVPMMRRYGFTVLACGPQLDEDDGYYLVRSSTRPNSGSTCPNGCMPARSGSTTTSSR